MFALSWVNKWIESKYPLIDIREASEYRKIHLLGATNIPSTAFLKRCDELPPRYTTVCLLAEFSDSLESVHAYLRLHFYHVFQYIATSLDCPTFWQDLQACQPQILAYQTGQSRILWKCSPLLFDVLSHIERIRQEMGLPKKGTAIDFACGGGRDAVYLAINEWQVLALDNLQKMLYRAQNFAERHRVHINTQRANLEANEEEWNTGIEKVDLINVSRYLYRPLFQTMAKLLKTGGHILIHHFMVEDDAISEKYQQLCFQKPKRPKKSKHLLKYGELNQIFRSLNFEVIEDKIYTITDGRKTSWFWAKKLNT